MYWLLTQAGSAPVMPLPSPMGEVGVWGVGGEVCILPMVHKI